MKNLKIIPVLLIALFVLSTVATTTATIIPTKSTITTLTPNMTIYKGQSIALTGNYEFNKIMTLPYKITGYDPKFFTQGKCNMPCLKAMKTGKTTITIKIFNRAPITLPITIKNYRPCI